MSVITMLLAACNGCADLTELSPLAGLMLIAAGAVVRVVP